MSARLTSLTLAAVPLFLAVSLAACGPQSEGRVTVSTAAATRTAKPSATATGLPPTVTQTPEPATPTPEAPAPSPEPSPIAEPPTTTALPPTSTAPGPTAVPTPPAPGATPPPPAPIARPEVVPAEVAQGGAVVVRVQAAGAAGGVAEFAGRLYPLAPPAGGSTLWAVVGLEANHPAGPQTVAVRLTDAQGATLAQLSLPFSVAPAGYPVEYIELPPDRVGLLAPAIVQEELARRAAIFDVFTPERLWAGPFLLPVAGPLTSPYGVGRSYNGAPVVDYHHGTDISAVPGTPIVAANSGRVAFAGELAVRGISVFIDHGLGVFSSYHHMSQLAAVEGQFVSKGDLIGYVGDTGLAEGAHLHWEVAVRGVNVDPLPWTQVEYGP